MSLLIKNANIATMDGENPSAASAVVTDGFFAFVGSERGAEEYVASHPCGAIETLDLGGGFMLPGFNDSHMHYLHYVKSKKTSVSLTGCTALSEVIERMRKGFLEGYDKGSGLWLVGEGWNQDFFTDEKRFPTAADLDGITTEYPILIMRACFHIGVLNSRAMALLNLDKTTAGRYGDYVETDERGVPNGVIKEKLFDDIKGGLPSPSPERLVDMMCEVQEELFRYGLTSVQSDDFAYMPEGTIYEMTPMLRKAAEEKRLKLRIAEQALLPLRADLDRFLYGEGLDSSYGNRTFKISCVKLISDGSLGARTALMRKPYNDAPDRTGIAIYTQDELDALVGEAHRRSIPAAIHAIGDGAVEMALNAIGRARREYPYLRPRHGIVHCQLTDARQLERFRELDVLAYVQPIFIDYDMHIVYSRAGEKLVSTSYAWKTLIDSGVHTSFGTDCPVESFRPLPGIYCAVTRRDLKGSGPFLPDERVTRAEALYAYTAAGAYASGDELVKGKIRPGMYADFTTLDTDLLTCPDEDILKARVTGTYIDGERVF